MEHLQDIGLHRTIEVDQQVAATDQVQLGERRVAQQVVHGEQHMLADFLLHPVAGLLLGEVLAQALRGHVRQDRLGVGAAAADGDGMLVDIGGEDLELALAAPVLHMLGEQHGHRVGLLAGRTTGAPHPHRRYAVGRHLEQSRDDLALQRLEGFAVAEEVGHPDQHVVEQVPGFLRVGLQVGAVARQVVEVVDLQATLDAAQHGGTLVVLEIMTGTGAQQGQYILERGLGLAGLLRIFDRFDRCQRLGIGGQLDAAHGLPQLDEFLRDIDGGQDEIHLAGGNGAARHVVVFGIAGRLGDGHPTLLLDPAQPGGTVAALAAEDDAHGMLGVGVGQGAHENIDGDMPGLARVHLAHPQVTVVHGQLHGRGNQVDVVALDRHRLADLTHPHLGDFLQDVVSTALVVRRQVHHHHKGHAIVVGHVLEQPQQGIQPPCRRSDADHREAQMARLDLAAVATGRELLVHRSASYLSVGLVGYF
ncbi:MAG: hypothetical protein GAK45_01524 [Pseudomonas citronellolis]|nr:MAG: hypothetical protein GAK45_01524 [Pseudomonas citronellolis]